MACSSLRRSNCLSITVRFVIANCCILLAEHIYSIGIQDSLFTAHIWKVGRLDALVMLLYRRRRIDLSPVALNGYVFYKRWFLLLQLGAVDLLMLLLIMFAIKSLQVFLIILCFFVHCFIVATVSVDLGRVLSQRKEGFPFIACLGVPQSLEVLDLALLVVMHLIVHKVLFDGACSGWLIDFPYIRRCCD